MSSPPISRSSAIEAGIAPHRRLRGQGRAQAPEPGVARRAGAAADDDSAARRGEREDIRRETRARSQGESSGHGRSWPEHLLDGALHPRGRALLVERVAPQAVAERHRRDAPQLRFADLRLSFEAGERAGGADQGQFAAQIRPSRARDRAASRFRWPNRASRPTGRAAARGDDAVAELPLRAGPMLEEGVGIAFERVAPLDDLDPASARRAASGPRWRGRTDREAGAAVRPLPGCRCRSARTGRDAGRSGPPARRR